MKNNLIPSNQFENIKKFSSNFLGFTVVVLIVSYILFTIFYGMEIYFDLPSNIIDPIISKYLSHIKYWISGILLFGLFITILNQIIPNSPEISDNSKLLKIKNNYYQQIIDKISLSIDSELEKVLNKEDFDEAEDLITNKIDAFNNILEIFTGKQTGVLKGTDISSVATFYESTTSRIDNEIDRQKTLSWLNLFVGLITTFFAVVFLIFNLSDDSFTLEKLIPRLSISLLIEIFSFYFLNLYKKNQEEIKFWNNEKTNLDIKLFALGMSADNEEIAEKDFMQNLILELLKTERNNLLKKDDTTVEIEKAKLENLGFDNFINKFSQMFDVINSKK